MPTQQQIAKRLNIAQITVSRALRGEGNVSPALRERILAEAASVGYSFNEVARSFAQGKTGRIGIVIPGKESFENRYFCGLLVGFSAAAKEAGMGLVFLNLAQIPDAAELKRAFRSVDGFVVRNSLNMWPWLLRVVDTARSLQKPYVLVQGNRTESAPAVAVNDTAGAVLAVAHLYGLGHRRIAFNGGGGPGTSSQERLAGYVEGLRQVQLPYREDFVSGRVDPDDGVFLDRLWAMPPEHRPTALFAWSDVVAVNDIHEAAVRGIRVPEDLSIIGFSDFMVVPTLFHPHLTTLHIPAAKVGERAIQLVVQPPPNPEAYVELLEPTLVIRESTAAPNPGAIA